MSTPASDCFPIHTIRETKVIIDSDLAKLYGVPTKRLLEQMRRNADRFPPDFCFQLENEEMTALRSQFATSKAGRGGPAKIAMEEHRQSSEKRVASRKPAETLIRSHQVLEFRVFCFVAPNACHASCAAVPESRTPNENRC